uniref:Uncharacterized protein n=1 Tax=Daphnia magna TaxID=35525 RepID=A0A0P5B9X6_9CRUS
MFRSKASYPRTLVDFQFKNDNNTTAEFNQRDLVAWFQLLPSVSSSHKISSSLMAHA